MSNLKFSKSKFSKFLSSKSFYVAAAVCLVGAGAATWVAVDRTVHGIEDSNQQLIESETQWNDSPQAAQLEEVDQKQSGIKQESPASSASSSSAPPSSKPSSSSASSTASASSAVPAANTESSAAQAKSSTLAYALPVKSEIINAFSNGELMKNTTLNDWRTHDGIDLAAEKGADVLAAADGTVSSIRSDPLWGTVMTIDHADGNQTIYSGLDQATPVKEGDAVMARQVIGTVEGVPCEISDASHLHFAIKTDGQWVDPLSVLQQEITDD